MPSHALKQRIHFNKFMLNVHQSIHDIKRTAKFGNKQDDDPLSVLADKILLNTHLLFFDEFQVTDIADAMLMSRLFTHLFERGLVVFFTSNRVPTDLYWNGLQRELFLPFVDQIYHYCDVMCLDSPVDYRKKAQISRNRVYFNCDYEEHLLNNLVRNAIKQQDSMQTAVDAGSDELHKLKRRELHVLGRNIGEKLTSFFIFFKFKDHFFNSNTVYIAALLCGDIFKIEGLIEFGKYPGIKK